METKTLSYFAIPALSLMSTLSFAAIHGNVYLTIENQTSCSLKTDPAVNCGAGESTIIPAYSSNTIKCAEGAEFILYYNPDSHWNHMSSVEFNHYMTSSYTYFMQSYGFQPITPGGFDGTKVSYAITPTLEQGGTTTLYGTTSMQLSDDPALPSAHDWLNQNNMRITVNAPSGDTCNK